MNSRLNESLEEIRELEKKVQSEMAHISTLAGFR